MSAESSVETASASLHLTPDEKRLYGQLFRQADTGNAGVVTGEVAVKFFDKTRLDSRILGEIWQIADKENRGFLTPAGFGIVLRLIGHAQAGREPTTELAFQPGQLPRFDGFAPPPVTSPTPAPATLHAQATGGPVRIPPLTPEKVTQYGILFERQPLVNNTLPGDQAKQIFEKSGLPNEVLGRIWMLADTEQRGALVQTEFVIAMHLLTSMKTGTLRALPTILPAPLYEAATRRGSPVLPPHQSPTNTGVSAIPRQMSGNAQRRPGSPLGRPPLTAQSTGGDWAVTPADKVKFDHIFSDLDKGNKGYITGEEAVNFFSQSNLGEDALAQIWDLADINSHGQLTRDEFAVAMFLIRQQRGNRSNTLPTTLPPNLIPPSLRTQQRPQTSSNSAFDVPPVPQPPPAQPKSALDDLFGLDSTSSSPAPPVPAQPTGGSGTHDPFAGGSTSNAPSSPIRATATGFKPFIPTSSFGRGLTSQPSGESGKPSGSAADDLLGDAEPEESKKISGESAELANLSNQISSLAKQTQDTQAKRAATQNEFNQTNSQKQTFEQRLSQLRTLYEKEAEDTRALEEQLKKARQDTEKLRGECMTLEGTYRDLQGQHQEVSVALEGDRQENTKLRERIRVVNGEIAQLKPQIDKLKSDARQQKGLVAINKKQLSTTEGERDKLKGEAEELTKSNEEAARQASTSSTASPTAQVASPALSTSSGNNPFFKRSASTDIMGAFASPPPRSYTDNAFDDVFGPSQPSASPPPVTSFKHQHTGNSAASASSAATPAGSSSPSISRQATLTAEPPAPPESRQISSSFLPFPDHTESLSSSRQVSPPASRGEGSVKDAQSSFSGEASSTQGPASVPGAFPGDEDKQDTPVGTPAPADVKVTAPEEDSAKASDKAARASDPFASMDNAKAKEEFDNAFAAFSSANKGGAQEKSAAEGTKNKSTFDSEFPPISELERDDESESESERGGFDDDFAPTSPEQKKTTEAKAPEADKSEKPVERSPEPASSSATITAPTDATGANKSNVDDIFGAAGSGTTPTATQQGSSNKTSKGAFDDLDDDFEGLEDAKEGSADDDFANISRSGLDDFNPVFDSSPPPSQAKSESTAFGNESSFDFIPSSTANGAPAPASGNQQKGADSHDWDAIFGGLDSPSATAAPPLAQNNDGSRNGNTLAPPENRPAGPGRALTEEGEHDDPIVKDLMGLGYGRSAAVTALEKFDYNLEKAANHLASQS